MAVVAAIKTCGAATCVGYMWDTSTGLAALASNETTTCILIPEMLIFRLQMFIILSEGYNILGITPIIDETSSPWLEFSDTV